MRKKKIILWALAFLMAFTVNAPFSAAAAAVSFPDMPANWSTKALENAVKNGLITGVPGKGGSLYIRPNNTLKRAEMASIINKAFNCDQEASMSGVNDVKTEDWFYKHMALAVQMGSFAKASAMRPNDNITREEAFTVLAKVFKLPEAKDYSTFNRFSDAGSVSEYAKGRIASLLENDYIAGSGNWIHPKKNITRAEFATVMDNIVKEYVQNPKTVSDVSDGNVIVNVSGATLQNLTVSGDLIIADGVGQGDVTLDNVDVEGRLVIRGGGSNSIEIAGNSLIKELLVDNVNNQVRIYASKGAKVTTAKLLGKTTLDGTFSNVYVVGTDAQVDINGTVQYLDVQATANIALSRSATVTAAEVQRAAGGTVLQGQGNLERVTVRADRTQINTNNTRITVDSGVKNVSAGNSWLDAGKVSTSGANAASQTPPSGSAAAASDDAEVSKVTLSHSTVSFPEGKTDDRDRVKLVATISPSDARDKSVKWDITGSYAGRYELYETSSSSRTVGLNTQTDALTVYVGASASTLSLSHTATVTVTTVDGKRTASCKIIVGDEKSTTPKADVTTVAKTSSRQKNVKFTLTNSSTLKGDWRVYTRSSGSSEADGVTCSNSGSTLTLYHNTDVGADTYYVAITESGHTESDRLALTVSDTGYSVKGTVTADGKGVPATVRVKNSSGNLMAAAVKADSKGAYTVSNVPRGSSYIVEAEYSGYNTGKSGSFNLNGDTTGRDVTLSKGSYSVSGRVTGSDAPSGLAASLQLQNSSGSNVGSAVTANASGYYTISNVSPANGYTVSVSMTGYTGGTITSFNVSGSNVSNKDITLQSTKPVAYTVSGKVTDAETKTALKGANVVVSGGGKTYSDVTKDDGSYSIAVFSGTYKIDVTPPGTADTTEHVGFKEENFVLSGKSVTKDIPLTPKKYTVTGTVTSGDKPLYYAAVTLKRSGSSELSGNTNDKGQYQIKDVAAGTYTMTVKMAGYEDWTQEVAIDRKKITFDMNLKAIVPLADPPSGDPNGGSKPPENPPNDSGGGTGGSENPPDNQGGGTGDPGSQQQGAAA